MERIESYLPRLLGRDLPLLGIAGFALINCVFFSPIFDPISQNLDSFARGTVLYSQQLYSHLTSLLISTMTVLIAGIPAAIYERIRGLKASTPVSLGIWLVATVLLSLPTIIRAVSDD